MVQDQVHLLEFRNRERPPDKVDPQGDEPELVTISGQTRSPKRFGNDAA